MKCTQMFIVFSLFAFCLSAHLPAQDDWGVEVRAGYFMPTDSTVQKVYGDGWAQYQIELTGRFCCNWQAWANTSWFCEDGRSYGCGKNDSTSIRLLPVSLGLKYFFPVGCDTEFYVGAGATYSFLKIKDNSPYVSSHLSDQGFGGVGRAGLLYYLSKCTFVDVFIDYMYQKFTFSSKEGIERRDLNISGVTVGAGLGVEF